MSSSVLLISEENSIHAAALSIHMTTLCLEQFGSVTPAPHFVMLFLALLVSLSSESKI